MVIKNRSKICLIISGAIILVGAIVLHIFAISLLDIQFYTPQTLVQIAALILCCRSVYEVKK